MYNIAPRARFSSSVGNGVFNSASLDLHFAKTKSLVDATTGASLVTFTRASSGTFVGSGGVLQSAVTNLLLRSEEFDNVSWTKYAGTVSANSIASPAGAITADTFVENTSNALHRISGGGAVVSGSTYTTSVYAKYAGRFLYFNCNVIHAARATFDLQSGTVATVGAGSAAIVAMGNGWYRCSVTGVAAATVTEAFYFQLNDTSVAADRTYTGDGTSGVYLWGAQLEQSSTVGEYIPTTSTINSAPRFNHDPTTGESLGLLVEEARTNSIANNTGVGAIAGTPGTLPTNWLWNTSGGASTQVVGSGTEDGIPYVDVRLFGTTTNGASIQFCANTAIAAVQNQTWTESFYCKLISGTIQPSAYTRLVERSSAGGYLVEGNASFVPGASSVPLGRSRFTLTRTLANASTAYVVPAILFDYVGTVDFTLRIGLPQLEQGAFATSVIPTTTATVTRAADVASITGTNFSSWYNQTEGTVFTDCSITYTVPGSLFPLVSSLNDNTSNNRLENGFLTSTLAGYEVTASGSAQVGVYPNAASALTRRLATNYQLNNFAACVNGGSVSTDTSGIVPTVNQLRIGDRVAGGTQNLNGTIKRLTYWPTRLANTTLQQITRS